MTTTPLAGKTALVTGGSRGIGAATARLPAEQGATVAITHSSSPQDAEQVVKQIEAAGGRALSILADAADEQVVASRHEGRGWVPGWQSWLKKGSSDIPVGA